MQHDDPHSEFDDEEEFVISKSQVKREMHELQALGVSLLELSDTQLSKIPVPEELMEQLVIAKKITHHSGKKRQLQYIGKVMRRLDPEPIRDALEELRNGAKKQNKAFQKLEQLRDTLVEKGDAVINEVLEQYPGAERQTLRQLVRQAQKEQKENKPPAAARKLFRYLREQAEI